MEEPLDKKVCFGWLGGREFPATPVLVAVSRPTLNEIKQAEADVSEEPWNKFVGCHGDWRHLPCELAGKTLLEIATPWYEAPSAICMAIQRIDQRMAEDKPLPNLYSQVQSILAARRTLELATGWSWTAKSIRDYGRKIIFVLV